jgi:hypothetical protein
MRTIRVIGFAIIGFFLAFWLYDIFESGYFQRWEKLASPSEQVSEYFSAPEKKAISGFEVTKPCDYSMPEFSILSNAPKNSIDCVQTKQLYPEGEGRATFVRDNAGNIWEWSNLVYVNMIALVCWPGFGALIGIIAAIVPNKPAQSSVKSG